IPIAVVLTSVQAYMQAVRPAFSTSQLRFQPTQDYWHHDAGGVQSVSAGPGGGGERDSGRGVGSGSRGGSDASRGGSREGGPPPGVGSGSGARFGSFSPGGIG